MQITFLGATGMVTGSSYALTSGSGQSILIDLGMFQGTADIDKHNYEQFGFDSHKLSGVFLTHAHLDHCGRMPILLPLGYTGNIWMTSPTRDLMELSLYDSAHIAKEDGRPFLYDSALVEQTLLRCKTIRYHETVTIGDFSIIFRNAGHILGSASLEIVDNKPNSSYKKIIFSGDLGNSPEDLEPEVEYERSADAVVMESTYGDRLHPKENPNDILRSEIHAVEQNGGTLLIPAFSLERTQELLHMIMHLKNDGKISAKTPIIMDSPMAEHATDIYKKYPSLFNDHIQKDLADNKLFTFPGLVRIANRQESEALYGRDEAKVIIAGSGMMTGGRIIGHAEHYLPIPNTRMLIVGYQGVGTLGRELLEGAKTISIHGTAVHVQATIHDTQAMSSHADQNQLLDWLSHIKRVKKVILTHGENTPRKILAKKIMEKLSISDITMPLLHDVVTI
jgi:metallo-beta-lactamase family protein